MAWNVEVTNEFADWFGSLDTSAQEGIAVGVELLEVHGPAVGRPWADTVKGSRHGNLKELRVQCAGDPYRVFFAFDPRRFAVLLIGGNKAGDARFYERMIPLADRLYDVYLKELREEGLI